VPFLIDHGLNALGKAYHVAVEPFQYGLIAVLRHANHVYGPNGSGFRTNLIQEGYYLLFIGYRYVEAFQVWVLGQNFRQFVDAGNFKILILSIDALVSKLLIEIADRE
jgi:hypothetical protein